MSAYLPRHGFLPALAVVGAAFAVWLVPAAIDGAIKPDEPIVGPGETRTLEGAAVPGGKATARLTPMEGWAEPPSGSKDLLILTRGSAVALVQVVPGVRDAGVFLDRHVRELRLSSGSESVPDLGDLRVTETGRFVAGSGLSGVQGAATATEQRGQLVMLAKGGAAVVILSLAAPGAADAYEEQLERMIDSVEIAG